MIDADDFADHLGRMAKRAYPNLLPGLLEAMDYAKEFPAVDAVEVVHGNWLDVFTGFNFFAATCSVCQKRSDLPPIAVAKYCPNCGARMDGEGNA